MENYIVINGKKAELTPEQLKALGIEVKKPNPFARVKEGEHYYYIEYSGKVLDSKDMNFESDNDCYNIANYCADESLMRQRAYHETLSRLLWRYSMEHDGDKIDWGNSSTNKYYIVYCCDIKTFDVRDSQFINRYGAVYFHTREIAESAIREIINPFMGTHPDFKL